MDEHHNEAVPVNDDGGLEKPEDRQAPSHSASRRPDRPRGIYEGDPVIQVVSLDSDEAPPTAISSRHSGF